MSQSFSCRSFLILAMLLVSTGSRTSPAFAFADDDRPSAQGPDIAQATALFEQGEKSLLDGHYADAGEFFARAAALDPDNPRSRLSLAFSEFALGRFDAAALTAHEVMKTSPELADFSLDMRGSFGEIGIVDRQLTELEKFAILQPETSRLRYLRGFIRFYTGDRDTGAQLLSEYAEANPEDFSIHPFIAIASGGITPASPAALPVEPPPLPVEPPPLPVELKPIEQPRILPQSPSQDISSPPPTRSPRPAYRNSPVQRFTQPPKVFREPLVTAPAELARPRPKVQPHPVPQSETLTDIAIREFCRENDLDPFDNNVLARVTDVDYDDDTRTISEAKIRLRWTEWKRGRYDSRPRHKSDTVKLEFDKRGRLTDYDD